jgi:hypothetical protein
MRQRIEGLPLSRQDHFRVPEPQPISSIVSRLFGYEKSGENTVEDFLNGLRRKSENSE